MSDIFMKRTATAARTQQLPPFAAEVKQKVEPYGFTVEVGMTNFYAPPSQRANTKPTKQYGIYAKGAKTRFVAFCQMDPLSLDPKVVWSSKLHNRYTQQNTLKAFLAYVRHLDRKFADAGLGEHPANQLLYLMGYWFNDMIPDTIPLPDEDDLVKLLQLPFSEDFKMAMIKRGVELTELESFKALPQSYVAALMGVNEADYEPAPTPVQTDGV